MLGRMPDAPLRAALIRRFRLGKHSLHGPAHWARVQAHAERLALASGGDVTVARYFAWFHDAERLDESYDLGHGARAAALVRAWRGRAQAYRAVWAQDWASLYLAVRCPLLLLCAEDDVLHPYFARACELRPDAVSRELLGANFEPDLDVEGTRAALVEFLARIEAA